MEETKRYVFKKDYVCSMGKINEGREITFFRGIIYLDGIIVVNPYAAELKKLFDDDKFLKEYIKVENIIKNKV